MPKPWTVRARLRWAAAAAAAAYLLTLTGTPHAAATQVVITVSPSSGIPGSVVTVGGVGWTEETYASGVPIEVAQNHGNGNWVRLEGGVTGIPDANGNFAVQLEIPTSAQPGLLAIYTVDGSGGSGPSADFTVPPQPQASHASSAPPQPQASHASSAPPQPQASHASSAPPQPQASHASSATSLPPQNNPSTSGIPEVSDPSVSPIASLVPGASSLLVKFTTSRYGTCIGTKYAERLVDSLTGTDDLLVQSVSLAADGAYLVKGWDDSGRRFEVAVGDSVAFLLMKVIDELGPYESGPLFTCLLDGKPREHTKQDGFLNQTLKMTIRL
jgi:hypothetical protein